MFLFLILDLVFLWVFLRMKKRLTPYQIAGVWLVAVSFYDDWLTIASVNLGLLETTKSIIPDLVIGLQRVLLFPLLSVFLLEALARLQSDWTKVAAFAGWVAVFILTQYLLQAVHLISFVKWTLWEHIAVWSVLGVLLIGVNRLFWRLLQRAEVER